MYYVGCYIQAMGSGMRTVSAQFQVAMTFSNNQQLSPGTPVISLSSNLLQTYSRNDIPSINATFSTISAFFNYTFFIKPEACGIDVRTNEIDYVLTHMSVFQNVSFEDEVPPETLVTLTNFDPQISVFCLNLVAYNTTGSPQAAYLAQTIYYPHVRDSIQPVKLNPKKWGARIYVPLVLTCLLFVCAPVGIAIHRCWLVRRRAQKKLANGLLQPGSFE